MVDWANERKIIDWLIQKEIEEGGEGDECRVHKGDGGNGSYGTPGEGTWGIHQSFHFMIFQNSFWLIVLIYFFSFFAFLCFSKTFEKCKVETWKDMNMMFSAKLGFCINFSNSSHMIHWCYHQKMVL